MSCSSSASTSLSSPARRVNMLLSCAVRGSCECECVCVSMCECVLNVWCGVCKSTHVNAGIHQMGPLFITPPHTYWSLAHHGGAIKNDPTKCFCFE